MLYSCTLYGNFIGHPTSHLIPHGFVLLFTSGEEMTISPVVLIQQQKI